MIVEKLKDQYEFINFDQIPEACVCVECFTYNQAEYIKDALNGFLLQDDQDDFFVVIVDDASTDGTTEILREYAAEYPHLFKLMLARENMFYCRAFKENIISVRKELGKYVKYFATCEGDDYWTDSNKLKIQIEYMNNHRECMMYLHNSLWLDCLTGEKRKADTFDCFDEKNLSMEEMILIKKSHPATASRLFRKELAYAPDFLWKCSVGDYNLMLYAGTMGTVHYSDRVMCTYRYMSKGSTTEMLNDNASWRYQFFHALGLIVFLLNLDDFTEYRLHDCIAPVIRGYLNRLIECKQNTSFYAALVDVLSYFDFDVSKEVINYLSEKIKGELEVSYLGDSIKNRFIEYKHRLIFGTGVYGEKTTKKLNENRISFDGYVVSDKKNSPEFNGKPVWSLDEIRFEKEHTCIVVAVVPKTGDGVFKALYSSGYSNLIFLYDLSFRDMMDNYRYVK